MNEKPTNEERRRMINGLCNNKTSYVLNNDFFGKWFCEAFPDNNDKLYIEEWIGRFMKGTPFVYMDTQRLEVYLKHIKDWTGYTVEVV